MKESWLLFELENLQVYTLQTTEDWTSGKPYTEVYWKRKDATMGWGPFMNICEAMNHFTKMMAFEKAQKLGNIIFVDFKAKKRI